ncbi:MAG: DUF4097 family beta strand repeat-containing protein [Vicinamibacterales bacterium]
MKSRFTGSLAIGALLIVGASASAQTPNHLSVPFSDSARPGTVRINVLNGSVSITAGSGREVVIDAKDDRDDRDRPPRRSERSRDSGVDGLRRLTQPSGLSVEESANVISISSPVMAGHVKLDIQVPASTSLVVRTVNGGDVRVDGVNGSTEVNSVNGSIRLTNLGGAVIAHATNGKVTATLRQVVNGTPMAFTSFNGDVDVTLPASAKANLKMRSDRGDVYTDFDVQTTTPPAGAQSDRRAQDRNRDRADRDDAKDKDKGKYRIDVDRSVYGSINGGGPDFELRTFNGDVMLRKAK